jgi:hypothetical protein
MAAKMPPERQLMEIAEKGGPVEELEKLIEREGQELLAYQDGEGRGQPSLFQGAPSVQGASPP